jgi:hypothetical protein
MQNTSNLAKSHMTYESPVAVEVTIIPENVLCESSQTESLGTDLGEW